MYVLLLLAIILTNQKYVAKTFHFYLYTCHFFTSNGSTVLFQTPSKKRPICKNWKRVSFIHFFVVSCLWKLC